MHYESAIMVWCVGAKKKLKVGSPNKIILYSLYDFGPSLSVDPKLLLKEGVVKVTKASYLQDIGNFDPSPLLVKLTLPLLEWRRGQHRENLKSEKVATNHAEKLYMFGSTHGSSIAFAIRYLASQSSSRSYSLVVWFSYIWDGETF